MITPDQYATGFGARFLAAGGRTFRDRVGPLDAWVGLTDSFIGIANMHFCAVLAPLNRVDGLIVTDFLRHVTAYADRTTSGIRGLGTAVCAFGGIVSSEVHPTAVEAATRAPGTDWGGESRSVVIDLSSGAVHTFTGTKLWGAALQGKIRTTLMRHYPPAALVADELAGRAPAPGPVPQYGPPRPYGPPPGAPPQGPPPGYGGPPYR